MNAVRAVAMGLVATLWTTLAAQAEPPSSGRGGGRAGGHPGSSMQRHGSSFRGHALGHHRFHAHGRHFVPFTTVVVAPPLFYAPPLYTPPPTYYAPPPISYAPPPYPSASVSSTVVTLPAPAYGSPASSPPPMPRLVEFPSGRYELRGDGIATPYTWVWIPNPPTAPPAGPSITPPTGAPTSGDGPPASRPQIYTWVDKQGVEHWTNRSDKVPRN